MTRILGDYNLIKQIGQGSLGTVFLAEHRFMKRQYVLKVLPSELGSQRGFIQRFEEEVGTLATLDHPNIVKVHTVSVSNGEYFLVSDCIVDPLGETTNLGQYLISREGEIVEDELLEIFRQIADALDYAHNKMRSGNVVIHGGLKPNNLLVGQGKGKIKILLSDFGLSRIVGIGAILSRTYKVLADALSIVPVVEGGKNQNDRYSTQIVESQKLSILHNTFLQNYAFLSPEQKHGETFGPVGIKADVYAFGVLAYYLITKELPEGVFEMPSVKKPNFKYNWDALVLSCLRSNPEKRPASLIQIMDDVARGKAKPAVSLSFSENSERKSFDQRVTTPEVSPPFQQENLSGQARQEQRVLAEAHSLNSGQAEQISFLSEETDVRKGPDPVPLVVTKTAGTSAGATVHQSAQEFSSFSLPKEREKSSLKPVLQEQEIEKPVYEADPAEAIRVNRNVSHYHPEPQEVKNIEPIHTDMVVVKGGAFFRGSNDGNRDEMPRHQINLSSFAMEIHPTTNEQFARFLEVMEGVKDIQNNDIIRLRESRIKLSGGKLSIESGYSKHPVVGVTWYGAVGYAKWVGKRLPTEAEWEIAARGGISNIAYPTGESIEKSQANFFYSDTTAVMSYAPNDGGIYDVSGNVYEWCQDWYGYNYYEVSAQEPDSPKGPLQGVYRVLRGGCWKSLKEDLRCSHRNRNNPGTVNRTYGFRCVSDVQ